MAEGFRIIHCIDSLGVGGGQAMMFELYKAIASYYPHINQTIILTECGTAFKADDKYIAAYGLEYSRVKKILLPKTLLDFAGKERIVILFHKLMCSDTSFFRKIYPAIPVVVINHTYTESVIYNRINSCDLVISVSKHMSKMLKKYNPRQRYEVVRNSVNSGNYEDIIKFERDEQDGDYFITGRINSLNKIKYSDGWLKWVAELDLPVRMIHEYIGTGLFKVESRTLAAKLESSPNRIRMLGATNDIRKKIARLKSWDITLYEVNRHEGVSMSLLESLACGIPVVCSNHYGNKEIIEDGVNGYVFESRGEAKEILTELSLNRDILKDLQSSTRSHFSKKLDSRHAATRYVELLSKVVGRAYDNNVKPLLSRRSCSQRAAFSHAEQKSIRSRIKGKDKGKGKQKVKSGKGKK